MANYVTNLFYANTECEKDLDRIEDFISDHFFTCCSMREDESIDVEFESKWEYPSQLIERLIKSLNEPSKIYIRILSHELGNEYVSFRIYSQGKWDIKY